MEHKQKQNEDSGFTIQGIRKSVSVNVLLQAGIIDNQILEKLNNGKLTVEDLSQNHDINKFLDSACCISGIMFKSKKEKMSIYQAMKKKVLTEDNALNLLEAQAATGFMIEPIHNKRYTVQQAVDEGVLGQELQQKMLDAEKAVTGYTDPKTGNTITLFQAMKLGLVNKDFGLRLLETQLATGGIIDPMNSIRIPVEMAWKKGYFSEELNKDLSENGKDCNGYHDPQTKKKTSYRQLLKQCVKDEKTGLHLLPIDINFRGLRRQVTAEELLSSSIITKDLYEQLHEGKTNVEEVSGLKSVQNYLEGTSPIAGVYIESSNMKMNIYQAKQKGLIMPGTSLVLLEAQMATGFLIDVVQNTKHTVEEAINKGLVGLEMKTKLIKAEKAVTGYDDPYTGEKISLFQALKKGLIVKEHGIRLLEAQIATGGIIDPVNSHRVPVEVAYQKGYFDEEMNRILSDPTDDTKGFFDPNTKENLTYLQLLERCRKDNKTGLYLLNLTKKGEEYFYFDEKSKIILKSITTKAPGRYNGQEVNIWELLHSEYITEEKRRELMKNLKSNLCTIEDIQNIVITIIHNTSTNASQQDKKIKTSNGTERDKHLQFDENTMSLLKSTTTDKAGGKYQGKTVSAWELLHSEYITEEKRRELMQKLKQKTLTIDNLLQILISTIQENTVTTTITSTTVTTIASTPTTTETTVRAAFQGLRAQVSPAELLSSKIIDEETFDKIDQGIVTVEAVSQQDSVKRYLQGTDSIAGVFIPSTKEKMSIYQAMKKGILRPGTALVLLEAQAATGFVIDPVKNTKLSVEEAVAAGLVGRELKDKLLSAERAVTGYTDPYTGDTISLFQSLKKDLIVKDHGIRLLEAQIATGGIIDPVHSHRVPVEVAYQRGYFDEEMSQILSDPSDDTKGFFDPNTHENLTYLQLLERCTKDPDTGLCLLNLVKKGEGYVQIDAQTTSLLKSTTTDKAGGKYQGKTVSAWELLHSEYITEEKRRELMQKLKQKTLTIDNLLQILISTIQEKTVTTTITSTTVTTIASTPTTTETTVRAAFQGLRAQVSPAELLSSKIIDEETFDKIDQGIVTVEAVSQQDSVKRYLQGTDSIAGVFIPSTKEKMSIYQAMKKGILRPGTALVLLEAQAATGFVIDPVKNTKLSVEEAVAAGLVGRELKDKLLSAERAVTGYTDPYTGDTISLFQSLKKDLIVKDHGIRLLEAQIATGGIIDPVHSHRVPVEVAYQRGYFDEEMSQILSDPSDDTKGFFDPNTHENLTYLQLLERCTKDPDTGLCLLNLVKKGEGYVQIDAQTTSLLKSTTTDKAGGKYQGKTVSAWELLHSEYITEEKRRELIEKLKQKTLTIDNLLQILISTIQEKTVTTTITSTTVTTIASTPTTTETTVRAAFQGLRAQVSPAELLSSKIIDEETFDKIDQGIVTVEAVSQQDSVKRYLQGTDSIAGVFIPSTKEKMSIYQAMKKGILRPGTALVLLEAQAATGFVIDPVKNTKLSVEEAVSAGLVGRELKDKLLSAERAVTGYTDPYTGDTISLFQSLKKDLIVKDHGIRLLEAQIATGGIIDPVHSHRVPVEVAYQRGYFDEEMSQILSDPSDDTKGFFDPNTHENLTYLQLLERCTKDPDTGLCLLNLVKKGEGYVQIDAQTTSLLKSTTTDKAGGKYQGKTVSAWELLHSEYITEEKRRELMQKLKQKTLTIDNLLQILISTIQEKTVTTTITSTTVTTIASTPTTTETTVRAAFQGLRAQVSPAELLSSKIIDEETFDKIDQGIVTVEAVSQQDSVKRYLQGTDSIAGVFIPSTKEKMSIYQAMKKGILRPGTALVLLEAQAATGFVIDPVKNTKLSVEEAVAAGLVGRELKDKLLSAERAVTGYTDPYTGDTISLFQSLKKDLIVKDHGIRLLEAQIATGGIIDPVHSHRVPVEVAYQRGYFDEEMSQILSDPSDDTKGFFDPNTHENLTYLQLLERCTKDPDTGLCLLNLVKKGEGYVQIDAQTTSLLKSTTTDKAGGKYQGKTVSAWELLHSEYITEEKRRELIEKLKQKTLTIDNLLQILISTIQEKTVTTTITSTTVTTIASTPTTTETTVRAAFQGLRAQVSPAELLSSKIIDEETFDKIDQGIVTVEAVSQQDSVKRYLQGTDSIAGVFIPSTKEKMSIYQAMKKGILRPGTALVLLEAQAATGFVIDPVKNTKLSVEEAVAAGLVGRELKDKLLSAERAVTGYTDPYTGDTISLFQSLKKDLIVKDHGIRLLEAQIATGGIIDPVHSHRVPVEVAYQRGYFDEEMSQILSDPSDDTKGFFDPNTHENLTYLQLLERCTKDPDTGLCLLNLVKKGEGYVQIDAQTTSLLKSTTTDKAGGKYQGKTVSAWELLHSEYITEEKRRELMQKLKQKTLTIDNLLQILISTIQEKTVTTTITSTTVTTIASTPTTTETTVRAAFQGLRAQVSPAELLSSKIIDEETFDKIDQGIVTVEAVSQQDSVKRYLQGTDSIAGVFIPSTKEKMSIYQAMKKGILRPGTALVLLEAQAATGFVIDPVKNTKLSVEEAVAAGLVGRELKDKLLSAERAVTGYTDPYTGDTISLFQSLKKDLIVKDHGIRLLEAQIATGGIIDPVHSHRVPVEVAYQRGYFDEEMSQILSDPSDDTKGFFDPNTHENLTYLQLLERCTKDPDTGLCLLNLVKKGEGYVQIDAQTTSLLKSTTTDKAGGKYQGKTVSAWELLHSEYITEEKRRELMQKLKQKTLTIDNLLQILISTIQEKTVTTTITSTTVTTIASTPTTTETTVRAAFQGLRAQVSPAELLSSKIIDEETFDKIDQGIVTVEAVSQQDSVKRYLQGTDSIAGVFIPSTKEKMSIYQAMKKGILRPGTALVLLEAQAATGFVIDPVKNTKLSVEEAVAAGLVGRELKDKLLSAERAVTGYTDPYTGDTISLFQSLKKDLIVKDHGIRLLEAQIATGGIIDPVHSHRVPVEVAYQRGYFDEEMSQILSDPSDDTKGFFDPNTHENLTYLQLLERCTKDPDTGLCLLNLVKKAAFQGLRAQVSPAELLSSKIIDEETFDKIDQGIVTVEAVSQQDSVKRYLQGTDSIAGVFIPSTKEKMSIYQAMKKGILRPGTALVLLEAQAATGFVIDPVKTTKLSVEEAVAAGLVGRELKDKLLSAERAVTGYTDPYTGDTISLFQSLKKDLIVKDHGIRLLEAQIATGGIIDPVHSHRVPVEVAYQRGYFDEEMSQILSDPSDDTKGFFDPNTHENLTYLQLLERCTKDPDTGLCLLNLVKKGEGYVQIDAQTTSLLKSTTTDKAGGKYQGKTVSAWELLHSEYITEEKRRELMQKLKQKTLTIDNLLQILISTIQEKTVTTTITSTTVTTIASTPTTTETTVRAAFQGLRAQVSPAELLSSKIIDEETFDKIDQGIVTVEAVSQQDSVKRYLQGTDSIAGVFIPSTKEKMSIYQAMKKGILRPGTALVLLEAQAATGFVIDPVKNTKLSVEEAVAAGLVGRELKDKLLSAERAVTGYTDPYTGDTISLFQSLKKDLIVKDHGIRLLEAQIATGGIIDPVHSHRVPVEVAYQRGYFDEEMSQILSDPSDDTKGFFDPNTHENLTYLQLLERCTKDPDTGLCLLNLVKKGEGYVQIDAQTTSLLKSTTTDKAGGKYQGKTVSAWELLHSEYITEEKRRELIEKLKQKTLTIDNLLQILISTIQEKTVTTTITSTTVTTIASTPTTTETTVRAAFQGLRAQVSPAELLSSKIIDEETFDKIDQGIVTVEAVSQQDSVKRYLQGTDSIAGVFIPSTKEKMSIYQAMKKGILRPGTALVLLEAQAATGFVIDPVKNTKLSVEEAVAAGLVGRQLKAKLLSAERAVTGYTDPYTGDTISLFQALKKDLIVKDHGIRLLEAQIATGGIIDPVHSHRVPVEVAYQRGYFDEEMSQILSDPSDDTKGFFDPNTHENLTYLQLLERCTKDPDTGLCLLSLKK
ncbi:epiplakin isoform X2 [Erpetoichthys calabaricus]|uniref:epiplakin isoform X2 n=1 Tax=Erpetoichthys calabaricus TaxID=27687 RepID=UPI002234B0FE|nr:epiplakin isoform X2 [Erpetoichthys calabaricus]